MRALDAAKAGGASYADIRVTRTKRRTFQMNQQVLNDDELALGVRALANGAWGFAAHTLLTPDVAATLGRKAAETAKINAWPRVPPIELIDGPIATTGHWETPIKRDPFSVPLEETNDLLRKVFSTLTHFHAGGSLILTFERQERLFASTDGAYTTQTIYTSLGGPPHSEISESQLLIVWFDNRNIGYSYNVPSITPVGAGYEALEDAKIIDHLPEWVNKAKMMKVARPFQQLGEYDVIFDAAAMAGIVNGTFGAALEYDRAVGYEASAEGTSYLAPPGNLLGTTIAPPSVTVMADRTMAGGVATVRWDDEGVTPTATPLINKGILVDYATSREFVTELKPWYTRHGVAVRSNGSAAAENALSVPLVFTPNLTLRPNPDGPGMTDLIRSVQDGLLVCGGRVQMDIQQLSGQGYGNEVYAIKKGEVVPTPLDKAMYIFKSPELWKNIVSLGGAQTAGIYGFPMAKGQPNQLTSHSVNAVAGYFRRVRFDNASNV